MELSVVIATHNRKDLLRKTLLSLTCQTLKKELYEVIVCDHGSTDGTMELCHSFHGQINLKLFYIPYTDYSSAEPKNRGINLANNEIVVIIDCGIVCPPHFLEAHLSYHSSHPDSYMAGYVFGFENETVDDFWLTLDPCSCPDFACIPEKFNDDRAKMLEKMHPTPWMIFWGCNLSVPKNALISVGGYDESFKGAWGWDDLDLGIRLHLAGYNFHFDMGAWSLHYPHPRLPLLQRIKDGRVNWIRSYNKNVTPELELWEVCDYWDYGYTFQRLCETFHEEARIKSITELSGELLNDNKSIVFWGYRKKFDNDNEYHIICPLRMPTRGKYLRSFGIRTPYADAQFELLVFSPYWQFTMFKASPNREMISYYIIAEAARVSRKIIFDLVGSHSCYDRNLLLLMIEKVQIGLQRNLDIEFLE